MLAGIVGFEWRYGTRRLSFAAAAAAFLLMGFALVATGYGPEAVNVNSPYAAVLATGLLSLPSIFVLTIFCTGAVQRDAEHRMAEIVFGTSVGKTRYLLGRFAGALLLAAAVLSTATLGMLLAPLVVTVEPERLGRADVAAYLWALAVVGLPNLVFAGTLVFAVAALSRSALAGYVAGVFVYALYFLCAVLTDSPLLAGAAPASAAAMARASLLDPFGLAAFAEQTRHWTPEVRDTRHLALSGSFLANRVLWLAVSAAVLAGVHRRFALRVPAPAGRARPAAEAGASAAVPAYRPVPVGGPGAQRRALASATRVQLGYVLSSRPFLALMVLWVAAAWANMAASEAAEYGSRLLPTTGILLDVARPLLSELGTVVLVYFAAELAWRDRAVRLAEIVDATPTGSAVFYLSRLAALVLTVVLTTAATLAVAVAFQLARGYPPGDPGLHLRFAVSAGLPLALFAAAALLAQALAPNRYVGMGISLVVAATALRGDALGLEHPLLRFGNAPRVPHSDMAGGGQVEASARAFLLYWTAFAGVLAFAAAGLWRRGAPPGLRARLAAIPRRLGRRGTAGAAACLLLALGTGGWVFRQTDVLNRRETQEQALAWRAGYERAYRRLAAVPQPGVAAVRAEVDLFPAEQRLRVAGTLVLENRTGRPVDTVWVAVRRDLDSVRVSLEGADAVVRDARYGMHGFRMRRPLAPGARAGLSYRASAAQRGIRASGFDLSVVDNGSFVSQTQAFPSIGYRAGQEIDDPAERRRRGLPPRRGEEAGAAESPDDPAAGWATSDVVVSTSADQVAVAPGELRGEWLAGGRRHFRYVLDRPALAQLGFVSARYAVRRAVHGGVVVEVYHHPGHARNVDRMLRAATASLDAFGRAFGPYPRAALRIVEVPPYWGFGAFALPGMVLYSENRGFLTDARDSTALDLVTRRVAHEVGHQWWPHQVNPGNGPGATMIVESLAKYAEQVVLRELRGERQVARMLEHDLERYLRGRAEDPDPERPLWKATGQPYLYYGKGAVVMAGLRDLLGPEAMDGALRGFVREHAHPAPAPTSAELAAALEAAAAPADRPLVDQWLRRVVVYDLAVESASGRPLPDGRSLVTIRVRAAKSERRGGVEVPLAMDEVLEVAVYAADPAGAEGAPLYAGRHRFRGGTTELRLVVPGAPGHAAVDPRVLRVDADRADNLRPVRGVTAGAGTPTGGASRTPPPRPAR
ncbi:MAG: M1 family aminopeptidase [Longimicrobiaceae bacterium]